MHGQVGLSAIYMGLLYVGPILAGTIIVFFLIKPLFARPVRYERSRSLTRQSEPLLFAFVDRVCEEVGAPAPKRINVDCQVNASASLGRGVRGMLGKDMVLTIGLPLLASLSLREFGGVLAHEFGHFAQGAGMRLTYFVRSAADWFMRLVYHRDGWDALLSAGHSLDIRLRWILLLAQLGLVLSRYVLWALMWGGLLVAAYLLRQMEYDADQYEVGFAGSDAFTIAMRKLSVLNLAMGRAQNEILKNVNQRRLANDLIGLMTYYQRTLPPEVLHAIETGLESAKTGWFDTHPSNRDRIAAAEALACPTIFRSERAASDLLSDFTAQCQVASWDVYLAYFGAKVPQSALQPIDEYLKPVVTD
jgi:Zn-dependent protease with chaperone function